MNETKKSTPKEPIRLSTTVSPKFDDTLRRHVYTLRMSINEVLEKYQLAYLEKEKAEKKSKKENKESN